MWWFWVRVSYAGSWHSSELLCFDAAEGRMQSLTLPGADGPIPALQPLYGAKRYGHAAQGLSMEPGRPLSGETEV